MSNLRPQLQRTEPGKRLLKWAAKDRCVLTFRSVEEAQPQVGAVEKIVVQWIKQL